MTAAVSELDIAENLRSRKLLKHRSRVAQIGSLEAFSEFFVGRREDRSRVGPPVLPDPQSRKAHALLSSQNSAP